MPGMLGPPHPPLFQRMTPPQCSAKAKPSPHRTAFWLLVTLPYDTSTGLGGQGVGYGFGVGHGMGGTKHGVGGV